MNDTNNVFIVNADIAAADADVIVNAANGWGYMGGRSARNGALNGVAERLCFVTEGEMESYCLKKARRFPHIPSFIFGKKKGEIFSSPSFGLNCAEVIHAVTMNSPGSRSDIKTVDTLVMCLFDYCSDKGLRTIAMPLLGTGTGRLNRNDVYDIIINRAATFPHLKVFVYTMTMKNVSSVTQPIKMNERNNYSSAELSKLLQMSKKSIDGLSYAIQTSVKIDPRNNYGKLSFEYVLMLLELISDKMQDEQTVQDFLG